jgi:hypothetical protein
MLDMVMKTPECVLESSSRRGEEGSKKARVIL